MAALAGALIGALAGGGGYLLTRHDGGAAPTGTTTLTATPPVTASGSPSATASPTIPTSTPTPTPTPTPSPTPTGPHLTPFQDPNGFTVLVPDGWQRRDDGHSVFYESPDKLSLVQVYAMGTDPPYDQALATDAALSTDAARFPGYHRIRLERTAGGTAELEYAYNHSSGTVRHAVDHITNGPNGTAYALIVAGPEGDWPTGLQDLRAAELTGFCFAAQCPSPAG
ncbi:hypothetical protein SAMN06272789_2155 [Streptomyces sp. 1331.2]|nr:hypothetical protein SAMN06272789_2155 [Streptomyces sp. 1331.2]